MAYQAGWYPDPTGRFEHRYYDGAGWTEHVATGGNQATDALDRPAPAATPPAPERTPTPEPHQDAQAPAGAKTEETIVTSGTGPASPVGPDKPGVAPPPPGPAVQPAAPAPAPAPAAPATVDEKTAKRRKIMSWLMVGCGAVVFLSAFLPWFEVSAFGVTESESGFAETEGKITALMGIGLALYAVQGLIASRPRVQFHGVVVAVLAVNLGAAGRYYNRIEDAVEGSGLDAGDLLGIGLVLTVFAGLLAIWPLVILWRDDRRQLAQQPRLAPAPAAGAATVAPPPPGPAPAPPPPVPLAPPADRTPGWQPDPTGRFELRYFDGSRWTEHVAKGGAQAADPV